MPIPTTNDLTKPVAELAGGDEHIVYEGRTRGELRKAFALVKDATNWKNAINAAIPGECDEAQLALIEDAVIFFTGGAIESRHEGGVTYITSEGYYFHIGS